MQSGNYSFPVKACCFRMTVYSIYVDEGMEEKILVFALDLLINVNSLLQK